MAEENRRLRKEVAEQRWANEILKAASVLAGFPAVAAAGTRGWPACRGSMLGENLVGAAGPDQTRLVGEDDRLNAIPQVELRE